LMSLNEVICLAALVAFLMVAQAIGAYQSIPIRPGRLARSPCFSEACSHVRRSGRLGLRTESWQSWLRDTQRAMLLALENHS
jgi:hypothetical protein